MKKHIAVLTALLALACTLTACGLNGAEESSESSRETSSQSAAVPEETAEEAEELSELAKNVVYEAMLESLVTSLYDGDYDAALSFMYPESACEMIKYMIENDDDYEDMSSFFEDFWDETRPMEFKEVVSEIPLDDSDKEYSIMVMDRLLYYYEELSEQYTKKDSYEQFCEEMGEMLDDLELRFQDSPGSVTDLHRVHFVLSDKKGIDFDFEADIYLTESEGWKVSNVEEADYRDWSQNVLSVSANAKDIYVAAKYYLLSAIADNIKEAGEKGFAEPCIISPDKDYCYNIDPETAEKICSGIAETAENTEQLNYFIGVADGEVIDIILCFKDNTEVVCSYPTGIIQYGEDEDDYENASALNFDEAYALYVEKLENLK